MNLFAVFLTGLFAGGLSCLAIQGGLLAATLADSEEQKILKKSRADNILPIFAFLVSKLIAYTLLGALLGFVGSAFRLNLTTQIILQLFVVIFMFGTAMNLLQVHPIFRYFSLQPPRFLTKLVRNQSKSKSLFAPALLGAFTVFIPCGVTQAMMVLAIGTGTALAGAATMFAFILGTLPVFFLLGLLTVSLGEALQQKFMKVAAVVIILLAIFNLNSILALTGFTWPKAAQTQPVSEVSSSPEIAIGPGGYTPNTVTVAAGSKVSLRLKNNGGGGCAAAFTIPALGVQQAVPEGSTGVVTFTAPTQKGDIAFMCSMGMYRGIIKVI